MAERTPQPLGLMLAIKNIPKGTIVTSDAHTRSPRRARGSRRNSADIIATYSSELNARIAITETEMFGLANIPMAA